MSESKPTRRTEISRASTPEEIAKHWDSHSLDDSWEDGRDVSFEIRAQRRRRVTLSPDIYARLATEALRRGIATETLVNLWLAERLHRPEERAETPAPPIQSTGAAGG